MKKSELKQIIKECISTMGYVDAKMEREPLSEKVVNFLMGNKEIIEEGINWTQKDDEYNGRKGGKKFKIYKGTSGYILNINGKNTTKGTLKVCKAAAEDSLKTVVTERVEEKNSWPTTQLNQLSNYDPNNNDFKIKVMNGSQQTKWFNISASHFEHLRELFKVVRSTPLSRK
jgi:hypothetical protein